MATIGRPAPWQLWTVCGGARHRRVLPAAGRWHRARPALPGPVRVLHAGDPGRHPAHNDGLTGVPNRRAWDLELQREMTKARRSGADVCVALLDLDHFKRFNDTFGHQAGDRLLKEASAAWRSLLRPGDTLARYGGEEFGVLLVGAAPPEAARILDRLREVTPHGQSFSAGLVRWDGVEAADEVVGRADEALYHAKHNGRNRVHLVDATPTTRNTRILA
ncbi:GGDEF domain-containing protein [Dactylosporangium sp. NPDC006015]|uniref:GGDEF domain-containing protein n=1 Tax=Dactylosporangium sp. NPDC006015 TaxID=3154576 RepID=UPI0033B16AFD